MNSHMDIRPMDIGQEDIVSRPATGANPRHDRFKKLFIKRFEHGWGLSLAGLATDIGFGLWRIRHRNASFADFYAHVIAARLARGGAHRTLGTRRYWTEPSPLGAPLFDPAGFRRRGTKDFEWFLRRSLRRDMTCIDYGCGSLRVGQHFIEYLDTGRYLGLDVIDDFYRDGLAMIDGKVIARSQPRFLVIGAEALRRASTVKADLIFATAVIPHVPPQEINIFFNNVIGLMHETSTAIVDYKTAAMTARIGANAWAHTPASLISAIAAIDPDMHARIDNAASRIGARHRREVLIFSRSAEILREWLRHSSEADARESEGLSVFTGEHRPAETLLHGLMA